MLSDDHFLTIAGSMRAKIFDLDGLEKWEYAKGDPYIRDLRNTSEHVGALTGGTWHPSNRESFATSSQDGIIREWNVERAQKQKTAIVYKSRERRGRSPATAVAYSPDGKLIVGAYQDGTLQIWNAGGNYIRPLVSVSDAHQKGIETSSILFSRDNYTVVTRGEGSDFTKLMVTVWDVRNAKKPVKTAWCLDIVNPEANVIFSQDERLILTGTACPEVKDMGEVVMLDRHTLEVHQTVDGIVSVFYSPTHSVRDAKLAVVKAPKQRAADDDEINRLIITPHALPMFKDEEQRSSKRKRDRLRKDPVASHRPDLPVNGLAKGGRVNMNQQQIVIKSFGKDTTRDEDPREALFKYAGLVESDPLWVSNDGLMNKLLHSKLSMVVSRLSGSRKFKNFNELQIARTRQGFHPI
ncbi:WD40 repeat-like protein [Backusella circina FSU 941]|nr:WD40 repeat-like protein [Backusella circina FSU 941]